LGKVITEEVHVAVDKTSGVVKLMGNAGGELAQTGHFFRVHKLALETLKFRLAVGQFDILVLEMDFVCPGGALQTAALQRVFH